MIVQHAASIKMRNFVQSREEYKLHRKYIGAKVITVRNLQTLPTRMKEDIKWRIYILCLQYLEIKYCTLIYINLERGIYVYVYI